MRPADFALERYFARWEFACKHLLCASGIEGWKLADLLALADAETRGMWDALTLGYTESSGHPKLRAEIARRYAGMDADDVHCFAGAQEAIAMAMGALVERGDHVLVVRPAYQSLFELAKLRGAELTELWLEHATGWKLDLERVRAALRPSTKLVVVNFPHNPTGTTLDEHTQLGLVRLVEEHGAYLLSDEVYRGLELDPAPKLPPAVTLSRRALSLGAMAKSYGLAGLRLGWLATRDAEVKRRVASLKDYGSMCNAAPSEILALVALRAEDKVLARSRQLVARNLPLLDAFMEAHRTRLAWVRPLAGVTAFPRFVDGSVAIEAFCETLVRETGVLLLPGTKYGVVGPHFRIGFGRSDFAPGLERLDKHLSAT